MTLLISWMTVQRSGSGPKDTLPTSTTDSKAHISDGHHSKHVTSRPRRSTQELLHRSEHEDRDHLKQTPSEDGYLSPHHHYIDKQPTTIYFSTKRPMTTHTMSANNKFVATNRMDEDISIFEAATIIVSNVKPTDGSVLTTINNEIAKYTEDKPMVEFADRPPETLYQEMVVDYYRPNSPEVIISLPLDEHQSNPGAFKHLDTVIELLRADDYDCDWLRAPAKDKARCCGFHISFPQPGTPNGIEALKQVINAAVEQQGIPYTSNVFDVGRDKRRNNWKEASGQVAFATPTFAEMATTQAPKEVSVKIAKSGTFSYTVTFEPLHDQLHPTSCTTIAVYVSPIAGKRLFRAEVLRFLEEVSEHITDDRPFESISNVRESPNRDWIMADPSSITFANAICQYPLPLGRFFRPVMDLNRFGVMRPENATQYITAYHDARARWIADRIAKGETPGQPHGLLKTIESWTIFQVKRDERKGRDNRKGRNKRKMEDAVPAPRYTVRESAPAPAAVTRETLSIRKRATERALRMYPCLPGDEPSTHRVGLQNKLEKIDEDLKRLDIAGKSQPQSGSRAHTEEDIEEATRNGPETQAIGHYNIGSPTSGKQSEVEDPAHRHNSLNQTPVFARRLDFGPGLPLPTESTPALIPQRGASGMTPAMEGLLAGSATPGTTERPLIIRSTPIPAFPSPADGEDTRMHESEEEDNESTSLLHERQATPGRKSGHSRTASVSISTRCEQQLRPGHAHPGHKKCRAPRLRTPSLRLIIRPMLQLWTRLFLSLACIPSKARETQVNTIKLALSLTMLQYLPVAAATPNQQACLSILSLNTHQTSAATTLKLTSIIYMITALAPSIVILTEFIIQDGTPASMRRSLGNAYTWYHTAPAQRLETGILVGILSSIPSYADGSIEDETMRRRILPISMKLPRAGCQNAMEDFLLIAAYAPQAEARTSDQCGVDVEGRATQRTIQDTQPFWSRVRAAIGRNTRWIVSGDFNIALDMREVSSGHRLIKYVAEGGGIINDYRAFLRETSGADLWCNRDELDIEDDFTFHSKANGARSVIDRTAIGPDIPGGSISVHLGDRELHETIDHRPILAQFAIPVQSDGNWTNTPRRPRLNRPPQGDEAYGHLVNALVTHIENSPHLKQPITNDRQYDAIYDEVRATFCAACESAFGRPRVRSPSNAMPSTVCPQNERDMRHRIKILKRARVGTSSRAAWDAFYSSLNRRDKRLLDPYRDSDLSSKRNAVDQAKASTEQDLRNAENVRAAREISENHARKTEIALRTGSVKKLLPNQQTFIPPLVRMADGSTTSDPDDLIRTWKMSFASMYAREAPPEVDKPWMQSNKARRFKRHAQKDPFVWPRHMTVDDLTGLLNKGKINPAPGPDDWEKWALRASGREWLGVIVNLANYTIQNNYFSASIRDNFLVPIYKRGDFTDPTNYRGIVLANTLQITVASWFTKCLQDYSTKRGLIPETQSAGRKGARTTDQSHLLNAIDGHLRLEDTFAYALKRDQKKGFDFLHCNGFKDAAVFFGLPVAAVDFETARARRVGLRIRCRGQIADAIMTDGLTKQGDPLSPLKYALTLAMAQWWIDDKRFCEGLEIKTKRVTKHEHTDVDGVSKYVTMIAAMDDTIAFSRSPEDLKKIVKDLERFQVAYNMETEWDKPNKTTLMLLGRPKKTDFSPVTFRLVDGTKRKLAPVDMSERRFLNMPINDPVTQFTALRSIVQNFVFPKPARALPMTAIRKITEVSLFSKIKARLAYHPITAESALALNKTLKTRIEQYYNFPYPLSNNVVYASPLQGGLGFPDIERENAVASVIGIHNLLNAEQGETTVGEIIHSEFQCGGRKNGCDCWPPLGPEAPPGLIHRPYTYARPKSNHPTWEIARKFLTTCKSHMVAIKAIGSVESKASESHANITGSFLDRALQQFDEHRELVWADANINDKRVETIVWATDGSVVQTPKTGHAAGGSAVVGPIDLMVRLKDKYATPSDAEIIALAIAIEADRYYRKRSHSKQAHTRVLSDYLPAVRFGNQVAAGLHPIIKSSSPSRAALRYLAHSIKRHPGDLILEHVKAHTDNDTAETRLNDRADKAAKMARSEGAPFGVAIQHLDKFALLTETGVNHDGLRRTLERLYDTHHARMVFRVDGSKEESGNNKDYHDVSLFLTTRSGYSAQIQAQIRSHQLPTPARNIARGVHNRIVTEANITHCCLCGETPLKEVDERHIFVQCPGSQSYRTDFCKEAISLFKNASREDQASNTAMIEDLTGTHVWQMWREHPSNGGAHDNQFYQGLLPGDFDYKQAHRTKYNKIAGLATKTTARIWWAYLQAQKGLHSNRRANDRATSVVDDVTEDVIEDITEE